MARIGLTQRESRGIVSLHMQSNIQFILNRARDEAKVKLHQGNKYALYSKYRSQVIANLPSNAAAERDEALAELRVIFLIDGGK